MDAPPVQYASSADGTSIAYCVRGEGPPLVFIGYPTLGHLLLEWEISGHRALYEALAAGRMLVRLDTRGKGLSQRDVSDFSLEALKSDIEAVADRLGLERFALMSFGGPFTPIPVTYAVDHPERVSHLILATPAISSREWEAATPSIAFQTLAEQDWDVYADAVPTQLGIEDLEDRRLLSAIIREHSSMETYNGVIPDAFDLSDVLPRLTMPLLVVNYSDLPRSPDEVGQRFAAHAPDARLVSISGGMLNAPDGSVPLADPLNTFLADSRDATAAARAVHGGLQTILFTDLEASTPLTQRLGDEGAQELLRGHNATVRGALDEHGGREVKHTGDGIMASFPSAVAAVTAALQIQRGLAGGEVRVRVGLNAGEPIAEDDDLFGLSVIKAARIADRAEPGQVLVSNVVRELCEGKTFDFASLGAVSLKGFDEAVMLFEVHA